MKIYSDQAVSKEDLDIQLSQLKTIDLAAIDEKQTGQIKKLRMWLAGVTVVNFAALAACVTWCFTRI